MRSARRNYRLRITHDDRHRTYITRCGGSVSYLDGKETPLVLSNLVGDAAAELRFKLEDTLDGDSAAGHVRKVLDRQWSHNAKMKPIVEVI